MPAYDLGLETYTSDGANPDHIFENSSNFNRHTLNIYSTYDLTVQENHDFKFMVGLNRVTDDYQSHYTRVTNRSEEHTSELQSLMRISYAVFCLKKKKHKRDIKLRQQIKLKR